jgi:hypothetical protein
LSVANQAFDPALDFVADRPYVVDVSIRGVVEVPVFVAFAGRVGARVAAASW